jgi:hypothetical protein
MGKLWVLQTQTKGTGATMVPLERAPAASAPEPLFVPPKRTPPAAPEPEPRPPRRFRVVDVATRELVAEDASASEAARALAGVRSIVDVSIYVWLDEAARWQLLPLADQRALWDLAQRAAGAG